MAKIGRSILWGFILCMGIGNNLLASECLDQALALRLKIPVDQITPLIRDTQTVKDILGSKEGQKNEKLFVYAKPVKKKLYEKAAVLVDYLLVSILAIKTYFGFQQHYEEIPYAIALAPLTIYLSDLIGQFFHKWLDSYANESHPIWGTSAQEFRKHHEVPSNLNREDYLSHVSAFAQLLAPVFIGGAAVNMHPALGANLAAMLILLLNSTEFHRQAHLIKPNRFFGILQKFRLAIHRDLHSKHHKPPFDSEFVVLNGWSASMTRRLDLWNRLDKIWWKFTQKLPSNWIQDPRSIPPEVIQELEKDLSKIPADLWVYAETYPNRSSPQIANLIALSKEYYQKKFQEKP